MNKMSTDKKEGRSIGGRENNRQKDRQTAGRGVVRHATPWRLGVVLSVVSSPLQSYSPGVLIGKVLLMCSGDLVKHPIFRLLIMGVWHPHPCCFQKVWHLLQVALPPTVTATGSPQQLLRRERGKSVLVTHPLYKPPEAVLAAGALCPDCGD